MNFIFQNCCFTEELAASACRRGNRKSGSRVGLSALAFKSINRAAWLSRAAPACKHLAHLPKHSCRVSRRTSCHSTALWGLWRMHVRLLHRFYPCGPRAQNRCSSPSTCDADVYCCSAAKANGPSLLAAPPRVSAPAPTVLFDEDRERESSSHSFPIRPGKNSSELWQNTLFEKPQIAHPAALPVLRQLSPSRR